MYSLWPASITEGNLLFVALTFLILAVNGCLKVEDTGIGERMDKEGLLV